MVYLFIITAGSALSIGENSLPIAGFKAGIGVPDNLLRFALIIIKYLLNGYRRFHHYRFILTLPHRRRTLSIRRAIGSHILVELRLFSRALEGAGGELA